MTLRVFISGCRGTISGLGDLISLPGSRCSGLPDSDTDDATDTYWEGFKLLEPRNASRG